MTKMMTESARKRECLRKEIYEEWKKMKKRGYSMRAAVPVLAEDYGTSISTVSRMLTQSIQMDGVVPTRSAERNAEREKVWVAFVKLREEGYSWYDACQMLGKEHGKHYQTISNWMREIRNVKQVKI